MKFLEIVIGIALAVFGALEGVDWVNVIPDKHSADWVIAAVGGGIAGLKWLRMMPIKWLSDAAPVLALFAVLGLSGCAAYDNADIVQPAGTTALGRFSAITLAEIDQAIAVADTAAMAGAKDAAGLKSCLVKVRGYVEIAHNAATGASSPVATAALLYLMRDDAKAALDQCGDVLRAT